MMRRKEWLIIILALASMLIFSACANYLNSADDFYGGDVVDAEMLSSIAESIFESDESLRPEETSAWDNGFSESGSEEVTEDSVSGEDVTTGLNSSEQPTDSEVTTEEQTTAREHDGVYYWTESGTKYHKWSDCGHLKNSANIISGTLDEAHEAGKEDLCSSCAKK